MELVEVFTGTNCGSWVLRFRDGRAVALVPWLLEELPQLDQRPRPTPWLLSTAFWGGRADRLCWAESLIPNRGGAIVVLRGSDERFTISPADVAALLNLLDLPIAA